jgi:hypothetical protein
MKAAISPKYEGRVITALPSSQFCLHLLIALLKYQPPAFDYDTKLNAAAIHLKPEISRVSGNSGLVG